MVNNKKEVIKIVELIWDNKQKTIDEINSENFYKCDKEMIPCVQESVNFINTENLYIEGDNLDALKLLRKDYENKIKMIYIDPPYNTGKKFIYNDKFGSKTECKHSAWLNMIYPRLRLARNLLSDDGVIFLSIDDNEVNNLKKVCDEIFGEENFICTFVRKNKAGSGHDSKKIAIEFDYILCFCKNINSNNINKESIDVENDDKYKLSDKHIEKRGKYYLRDLDYKGSYSETGDYPIITPDGSEIYSGGAFGKPNTWRWSKSKFEWGLENDYIVFKQNSDGWKVYIKQYQFVDNNDTPYERQIPYRALIDYSNRQGTLDFNGIMETNAFSFPKSVNLITCLLNVASNKESIILDFFSGSATTTHAVMQHNANDGGNRKFIMVQLPEPCNNDEYKNICEIGKERIRRAAKKIHEDKPDAVFDDGFKVLKIN